MKLDRVTIRTNLRPVFGSAMGRSLGACIFGYTILSASAGSAVNEGDDASESFDLAELSLEDLMAIPVYAVSRYEQSRSEAPASVSVISSDEIKKYGYRTLADILNSLAGFYGTNDRNYSYVGVRGFSPIGDINNRLLLLINGHRVNEPIFGTAPIGGDFPLDVDLIDHVEIVRGPSSSLYGNHAFFGVIDIITKTVKSLDALEVSAEAGSHETYHGRATYGQVFSNGVELLVSGTAHDSDGESHLFFKEFDDPETNNGIADHLDGESWHNIFLILSYSNLTLQVGHSSREKDVPTAAFEGAFNAEQDTIDEYRYVDLKYDRTITGNDTLIARLYYDYYRYKGDFPYEADDSSLIVNKDSDRADSFGGEIKYTFTFSERHKVTMGGEYRRNERQDQRNFDADPFVSYLEDKRDSDVWSAYGQNEMTLLDNLLLSAGIRYDHYDTFGETVNPRLSLVYEPIDKTVFKFLYGEAFRAPNVFELYYDIPDFDQKGNPDLDPETIDTFEIVWEQYLGANQLFKISGFYNEIDDLISQEVDPEDDLLVFRNLDEIEAFGAEMELLGRWSNGVKTRASYTYQEAEVKKSNEWLVNSPRSLAKFNVTLPLVRDKLFVGTEVQYISERKTLADNRTDDALVVNATLFSLPFHEDLEVSATLYNVFDEDVQHPGGAEHEQDILDEDGRTFRFKLAYQF